ncbi:MAG: hypothetical protein M0Z96_05880 [Actinomycetota bacterium]|nr:hypothetical protein [Actinomycetota bacterium]
MWFPSIVLNGKIEFTYRNSSINRPDVLIVSPNAVIIALRSNDFDISSLSEDDEVRVAVGV